MNILEAVIMVCESFCGSNVAGMPAICKKFWMLGLWEDGE